MTELLCTDPSFSTLSRPSASHPLVAWRIVADKLLATRSASARDASDAMSKRVDSDGASTSSATSTPPASPRPPRALALTPVKPARKVEETPRSGGRRPSARLATRPPPPVSMNRIASVPHLSDLASQSGSATTSDVDGDAGSSTGPSDDEDRQALLGGGNARLGSLLVEKPAPSGPSTAAWELAGRMRRPLRALSPMPTAHQSQPSTSSAAVNANGSARRLRTASPMPSPADAAHAIGPAPHSGKSRWRPELVCEVCLWTAALVLGVGRLRALPLVQAATPHIATAPIVLLAIVMPIVALRPSAKRKPFMFPFTDERGYRDTATADEGLACALALPVALASARDPFPAGYLEGTRARGAVGHAVAERGGRA